MSCLKSFWDDFQGELAMSFRGSNTCLISLGDDGILQWAPRNVVSRLIPGYPVAAGLIK